MLENFDLQRLRLKPYYRIVDSGDKVFVMMAPCEVYEIPRDDVLLQFLRKLEDADGLAADEIKGLNSAPASSTVEQVIQELWARGALMSLDGSEFLEPDHKDKLETWLPLISRFTNKPYEIAARLKECRIGILTNNQTLAVKIKKAIRGTQLIKNISVHEEEPSLDWPDKIAAMEFAIVALLGFRPAFLLKANQDALRCGTPMLPVILMPDGLSAIVGPLITKAEGPCWNCFYRRYAGQGANLEIYDLLARSSMLERDYRFVWSGSLLAQSIIPEVIFALTNIENPRTLGRVFCIDLLNFNSAEHPVLILPRCDHCSGARPVREKPCVSPYAF
ncbi:TOMM precursor leader peptide-binding protein [candidate division WOR-3 bacterium]|nr:TOMM precursor leader peptide-binding protein [candidate division WOR-3 bacterium]